MIRIYFFRIAAAICDGFRIDIRCGNSAGLRVRRLVKHSFGMLFFIYQNTSLWYARRQSEVVLFPAIVLITTGLVINGLRSWFCTIFFL